VACGASEGSSAGSGGGRDGEGPVGQSQAARYLKKKKNTPSWQAHKKQKNKSTRAYMQSCFIFEKAINHTLDIKIKF
jgi:hypothetical protein